MNDVKKKYAFISYSHKDQYIARWLQQKLESYKLPSEIHNEYEDSRYLRPIFRDETDLSTGILSKEISDNLWHSKYLIVICSLHSAQSAWVSNEVKTFIEWGRLDKIILFVIDGNVGGENDCRPLFLRNYINEHPELELLAIDIRTHGKKQAYIRVISRMLEIEFDVLWQRHLRKQRQEAICSSIIISLISILFCWFAVPIKFQLNIKDVKHSLPSCFDGEVCINNNEHLLVNYDTIIVENLPGYFRLQNIPVRFTATYYNTIDTVLKINQLFSLNEFDVLLERDNTFAIYAGTILDTECNPLPNIRVDIDQYYSISNDKGKFRIEIPIEAQEISKKVILRRQDNILFERQDECPSMNLIYMIAE